MDVFFFNTLWMSGAGVILGMALSRLVWHVDTAPLRTEIDKLRTVNEGLYVEVSRLSLELRDLQVRFSELEVAARETQVDLRASLRR